jgi:streptogramin lyase
VTKVIGGLGADLSAVAFGSGSVWLAGGNDGTLVRVDPRVDIATATHVLARAAGGAVEPVFFVAAAPGAVWATAGDALMKVDPSSGAGIASVRVPGPVGLVANTRAAWVCRLNESLVRVERSGPTLTASSVLSRGLRSPVLLGRSLWLRVDASVAQLWRVDPLTLVQESVVSVPGTFVFGLATGEGALWTSDHVRGTVWRIDPGTGRARALARLPHHPVALAGVKGDVWVGVQPDLFS